MGKTRAPSPSPKASPRAKSPKGRSEEDIKQIESKEVKKAAIRPKKPEFEYEFGGPFGAAGVVFGLPIVIYLLYYVCNDKMCLGHDNFSSKDFFNQFKSIYSNPSELISQQAARIYLGWMAFHVLLERVLPGEVVEGVTLEDGSKLRYRMSGHLQFWIAIIAMGHCIPSFTQKDVSFE